MKLSEKSSIKICTYIFRRLNWPARRLLPKSNLMLQVIFFAILNRFCQDGFSEYFILQFAFNMGHKCKAEVIITIVLKLSIYQIGFNRMFQCFQSCLVCVINGQKSRKMHIRFIKANAINTVIDFFLLGCPRFDFSLFCRNSPTGYIIVALFNDFMFLVLLHS